MDLSLSGQTSIFGGVFFVFKSLLGIERQKKLNLKKFIFDPKASEPRENIDISTYRTWPNTESCLRTSLFL